MRPLRSHPYHSHFFLPSQYPLRRGYFYLTVLSPTLVIEDPFDPTLNIGKSVFAMHRVKAAFNYALSALLSPSPYPYALAPRLLSRIINLYGKALPSNTNFVCWNPRRGGSVDSEDGQWNEGASRHLAHLEVSAHLSHLEVSGHARLSAANASPQRPKRLIRRNMSTNDTRQADAESERDDRERREGVW